MYVFVNNEKIEAQESLSVSKLLYQIRLDASKGIAVAVNYEVIPKSSWENFLLEGGENITIIRATQGG